ncbi:phosphatase domain-containing protein [Micromonospora sp. NBC_01813]|uniref:phosphatase domain-containing protein n=1 Tax=Micromonospora sp. NBC_01813 TaxID=2975988 RepID=UPI002DD9F41E|nr:AAA family ATPase [Micromonospora sp. NBC_01813]WSA11515.1 AAA family ATPase [Micromonospora sp. NBC_01813]
MPKLIVTRGLPGSGKSSRALAWVAEDPARRARVNRDTLRLMAHDGAYIKQGRDQRGTEKAIIAVRNASISALLRLGIDVINDDTNLPARTVRDLRRLATLARAEFEVWDMTDVSPEVCMERDMLRPSPHCVGHTVIRDMYQRFIHGRPYPLPIPLEVPRPTSMEPYVPDTSKPKAVIVDIDGTVALMGSRDPFDESRVHEDRPNRAVIEAVEALEGQNYAVIFCSGRTDGCREATEKWLVDHLDVQYAALHMRAASDFRPDWAMKLEIFNRHIRNDYNVVGVFDDRQSVVEMWRSLGLTVFQVAEGNF